MSLCFPISHSSLLFSVTFSPLDKRENISPPPPPAPGATPLGSPLHGRGNVGERQWHLKTQATIVRFVHVYIKIDTLFCIEGRLEHKRQFEAGKELF